MPKAFCKTDMAKQVFMCWSVEVEEFVITRFVFLNVDDVVGVVVFVVNGQQMFQDESGIFCVGRENIGTGIASVSKWVHDS